MAMELLTERHGDQIEHIEAGIAATFLFHWVEVDVKRLRALQEQGYSLPQIAAKTRLSLSNCGEELGRIGLRRSKTCDTGRVPRPGNNIHIPLNEDKPRFV